MAFWDLIEAVWPVLAEKFILQLPFCALYDIYENDEHVL